MSNGVTILNGLQGIDKVSGISGITGASELADTSKKSGVTATSTASFDTLLASAKAMLQETNDYSNAAEEAELQYAMGLMTNTHDLQVAQQKANLSLQYTVAVRNAAMDAYKEIMQLQF